MQNVLQEKVFHTISNGPMLVLDHIVLATIYISFVFYNIVMVISSMLASFG